MSRPTPAQIERQHLRWGLVTVVVATVVTYLAFVGVPFQSGFALDAITPTSSQLHNGSPVRIAGVNVGKVVGVERGPGNTARIKMRIDDSGLPLHRDASLKIRPRLFLEGNFFVDLKPGTPSAPELGAHSTIPLSQTAIPVQFDQVLTALQADTRADLQGILRQYAAALDRGGAKGIRDSFAPSAGAFKGIALVSQESQGLTRHDLSRFIADGAKISTTLNRRRGELADLITNFNRTVSALGSQPQNVAATTRLFADLVEEAHPALGDINASLPSLRRLARELRPLARRSPRTLDLALPLLVQLDRLVSAPEVPALLRDARPTLAALAAVETPLTNLLGKVAPVSACVRDNALPTLNAKLDDGALSSGLTVWQELLTTGVGLASAAQNFDANGPAVRLLAGGGERTVSTGKLPGVGELLATTPEPLIGSRPRKPASSPPYRPDVACETQKAPDLKADIGPAESSRRVAPQRMSKGKAQSVLTTLERLAARERVTQRPVSGPGVKRALRRAVSGK